MDCPRKRQRCGWNVSLVTDMFEEMVRARKRRQQRKQPLDEETTCSKPDLDKDWVEDLTNERNLDESEYERAFVNESLRELLETEQRLFWNR